MIRKGFLKDTALYGEYSGRRRREARTLRIEKEKGFELSAKNPLFFFWGALPVQIFRSPVTECFDDGGYGLPEFCE